MLLFLGAGASVRFGIPDTKGFIKDFETQIGDREVYRKLKENIPTDSFDTEVLMTILHDLSKTKDELHNSVAPHTASFLLEHPDEIERLLGNDDVRINCQDLLRTIKGIIRQKCLAQVKDQRSDILQAYDLFFTKLQVGNKPFSSPVGGAIHYPEMSIFTTNYDTCIEVYFNARQFNLIKGIVEKYGEYVLNAGIFLVGKQNFELLKLHGSVDLFVKDRRIRFLSGAGAMDTRVITYLGEEYGTEFMLYPVESSTSPEILQSPMLDLHYIFRKRLEQEKNWVIIGSTFRDQTLASTMNDVLIEKEEVNKPTVIHINPNASQINAYLSSKGYNDLSQVIKPIDGYFIDDDVVEQLKDIKFSS